LTPWSDVENVFVNQFRYRPDLDHTRLSEWHFTESRQAASLVRNWFGRILLALRLAISAVASGHMVNLWNTSAGLCV